MKFLILLSALLATAVAQQPEDDPECFAGGILDKRLCSCFRLNEEMTKVDILSV